MGPNPYESGSVASDRLREHDPGWLAPIVSLLLCAVPAGVAAYAWCTHWYWQRSGGYAQNSFPMNGLATAATFVAVACVAITGCYWGIPILMNRKRLG